MKRVKKELKKYNAQPKEKNIFHKKERKERDMYKVHKQTENRVNFEEMSGLGRTINRGMGGIREREKEKKRERETRICCVIVASESESSGVIWFFIATVFGLMGFSSVC